MNFDANSKVTLGYISVTKEGNVDANLVGLLYAVFIMVGVDNFLENIRSNGYHYLCPILIFCDILIRDIKMAIDANSS